jgi:peptide/nickel transport system substrate-binding protein
LQRYDGDTLALVPELAESVVVEDVLVRRAGEPRELAGAIQDGGDAWLVRGAAGETRVPKSETERVLRGVVFTFRLGSGRAWHDGHELDAHDVHFSWEVFHSDRLASDRRWQHEKISACEVLDARTVRFRYAEQHFNAAVFVSDLFLLPRHVYDPRDPDHARLQPAWHAERRARDPAWTPSLDDAAELVNESVKQRAFVGLGPYRLASWTDSAIEIERASTWRDDAGAGRLDRVRWRLVPDFGAAFRALLAGEIDFLDAVTTDDYFGSIAASADFRARWYTGTHRSQAYWYVGWNTRLPKLADPRVRRALAHLADLEAFRTGYYKGLARTMTGPFLPGTPACDPAIRPLPRDIARAEELLAEAGWIDRDGDGVRDKGGEPLSIELLVQAQNAPAQAFAAQLQQDFARGGVRLVVAPLEFNALQERRDGRRFEAVQLGWAVAPEADPEQAWHSRWAGPEAQGGSNFSGLIDPEVDGLIEAGQKELDHAARQAIWRRLHARLFELQPYLFCFAPDRKFALTRAIRGFQETRIDPNWDLRELYYPLGTPGTRPARRAGAR